MTKIIVRPKAFAVTSFVTLLLLNGLLVAIAKFIGLSLPISLATLLIVGFAPYAIWNGVLASQHDGSLRAIFILVTIFGFGLLLKQMLFVGELTNTSFNLTLIYILSMYFIFITSTLSPERVFKVIQWIGALSIFIIVLGYIQLFFRDLLPDVFVELPRIDSTTIEKGYVLELEDLFIYRPNGFIGNPITFGFFLLSALNIQLFLHSKKPSILRLMPILLNLGLIIWMYSRANISGAILIIVIFLFYHERITLMIVVATLLLFTAVLNPFNSSFIEYVVSRFTGTSELAVASNAQHLNDYSAAISHLSDSPLFGVPLGKYLGEDTIITDGGWFALVLDFGLPLFFIFLVIFFLLLWNVFKVSKTQEFRGLFSPFFIAVICTSFLNSAILSKSMFVYTLILLGLASSIARSQRNIYNGRS